MQNWSSIINNWALVEAAHALYTMGVFSYLERTGEQTTVVEICQSLNLQKKELEATLLFVSTMLPVVLERNIDGQFRIGSGYRTVSFQNILHFSRAYAPIVHQQVGLISGTMISGQQVMRDGDALSLSSEAYATNIAKDLVALVSESSAEVIVDLGCGSGHIGKKISEVTGLTGVGVDTHVPKEGLIEDFMYLIGDVAYPEHWKKLLPAGRVVLVASMVFHELLYEGEGPLLDAFGRYKTAFPGSEMYIVEYNGYSPEELGQSKNTVTDGAAIYQFVHPLTKQGMPQSRKAWRLLFSESPIRLVGEYPSAPNATIYKLQL